MALKHRRSHRSLFYFCFRQKETDDDVTLTSSEYNGFYSWRIFSIRRVSPFFELVMKRASHFLSSSSLFRAQTELKLLRKVKELCKWTRLKCSLWAANSFHQPLSATTSWIASHFCGWTFVCWISVNKDVLPEFHWLIENRVVIV